jgi:hypothetical protein
VPTWRETLWVRWLAWRNELPWRRPTNVEEGIWVGGVPTVLRWRWLRARGVSRFVSLLGEVAPPAWLAGADDALWLRVPDRNAPSVEDLRHAMQFLDESRSLGAGVLVFCGSGVGRAPTAYVAWCVRRGAEPSAALRHLQSIRPITSPTTLQRTALAGWASPDR